MLWDNRAAEECWRETTAAIIARSPGCAPILKVDRDLVYPLCLSGYPGQECLAAADVSFAKHRSSSELAENLITRCTPQPGRPYGQERTRSGVISNLIRILSISGHRYIHSMQLSQLPGEMHREEKWTMFTLLNCAVTGSSFVCLTNDLW